MHFTSHTIFLAANSDSEAEDTHLASCVLSSQIPGYDGGEVDTNETVEVMFPINVSICMLHMQVYVASYSPTATTCNCRLQS